MRRHFWLPMVVLVVLAGSGRAAESAVLRARAFWDHPQVHAGDRPVLAVVLDVEPGWHIYPDKAQARSANGFTPIPTEMTVTQAPAGLVFEAPQFPPPHPVTVSWDPAHPFTVPVYDGRVTVYLPAQVASGTSPGALDVQLTLDYQACDDHQCLLPAREVIAAPLQVVAAATPVAAANGAYFRGYHPGGTIAAGGQVHFDLFGWSFVLGVSGLWGLIGLLLVAGVGGFLLNLTPCVLPVIPLKIMSLARAAVDSRGRCLALGASLSLGVVVFWVALGAAIALSVGLLAGSAAGAGGIRAANQLFQYPWFTIGVGVIIGVMGLGMLGLFSTSLPQWVYRFQPRHDTLAGAFGFGILTAVLSTPCTAPFMGAAAAWAVTRPPGVALATFAAIGTGMALPYLLLAAFPGVVSRMPRAGPAGELIKQVMGLLILAAAAYFVGTGLSGALVSPPDPPSRAYWWVVAGALAAAGGWLAWRVWRITRRRWPRLVFTLVALGLVAVAGHIAAHFTSYGPIPWVYYTPQRLAALNGPTAKDPRPVLMDFTAEWCLNCKALEETVLRNQRLVKLLRDGTVVPMKVDLTGDNPAGNARLRASGRLTIPLLVVLAPDGREVFKSDFYTPEEVLAALAKAGR